MQAPVYPERRRQCILEVFMVLPGIVTGVSVGAESRGKEHSLQPLSPKSY